jgi:hypothetical protein
MGTGGSPRPNKAQKCITRHKEKNAKKCLVIVFPRFFGLSTIESFIPVFDVLIEDVL